MRLIDANRLEEKVREYCVYEVDTVNYSVNTRRMIGDCEARWKR